MAGRGCPARGGGGGGGEAVGGGDGGGDGGCEEGGAFSEAEVGAGASDEVINGLAPYLDVGTASARLRLWPSILFLFRETRRLPVFSCPQSPSGAPGPVSPSSCLARHLPAPLLPFYQVSAAVHLSESIFAGSKSGQEVTTH